MGRVRTGWIVENHSQPWRIWWL